MVTGTGIDPKILPNIFTRFKVNPKQELDAGYLYQKIIELTRDSS